MTEHTNETPSTNTNVEKLLHELLAQVSALTATVGAWINETKGDGGSGCTKKCQTAPVTPEGVQIAPAKRRGRPPKTVANAAPVAAAAAHVDPSLGVPAPAKRRGRPPKVKTEAEITAEVNATPKRRGRPPKAASTTTVEVHNATTGTAPAKRRGRPPKSAAAPAVVKASVNELSEEEQAWQEVDSEKEEISIPNAPTSMPPAFTATTPPPMPPPAFPPGLPVFPLA